MNKKLKKIVMVLFVLVLMTSSSLHKTLARFQDNVTGHTAARAALFDIEVQFPDEFSADQGLSFYSASASKKYHFSIRNNSEVTVKSQVTAKNTGFIFDFSETEFDLEPGENKEIQVTIKPAHSGRKTGQANIVVKTEQVD